MDESSLPDIEDIAAPEAVPDLVPPWLLPAAIVLGIVLMGIVAVIIFRLLTKSRAEAEPTPMLNPREAAIASLHRLKENYSRIAPNEFGLQASDALKLFMTHVIGDQSALYLTTPELASPRSQSTAPARLLQLIERCDDLKFSNAPDAQGKRLPLAEDALDFIRAFPSSGIPSPE